ncbi:MAG TPA: S8 family serine peptidase [Caldimonas sp.]|nr:S8 family serine peptidase [Caldimonas sp.]HEX2540430.1 S8 family serine peptidase [Caldimonas sp.]
MSEEQNAPWPIHLRRRPEHSSYLVIRMEAALRQAASAGADAAAREKRARIAGVLEAHGLDLQPLVTSVPGERVLRFESRVVQLPSRPSLTDYWRIDARHLEAARLVEVERALTALPGVELVYRERQPHEPVTAGNNVLSNQQLYLAAAPCGIDASWAHVQGWDGSGMHFIDLERAWHLNHEDLSNPALICNDNYALADQFEVRSHGTAAVSIATGADNGVGVVGVAPGVASRRVASYWRASDPAGHKHIADALAAAIVASPPPDVILIEATLGRWALPVDSDAAVYLAVQAAIGNGIVVVEAGGNEGTDLDAWTDALGNTPLKRSGQFDSGAIVVGAAESSGAHKRSSFSNFGSRIDCYAWGDSIVAAGYGDLDGDGSTSASYTSRFGGTSGASAILAGAALVLKGMLAASRQPSDPETVRQLLAAAATGTPSVNGASDGIGVMPDLKALIESLP